LLWRRNYSEESYSRVNTSCHFNEDDLKKFVEEVSKNCPIDAKKLQEEIGQAKGRKELAFQAINKVTGRPF